MKLENKKLHRMRTIKRDVQVFVISVKYYYYTFLKLFTIFYIHLYYILCTIPIFLFFFSTIGSNYLLTRDPLIKKILDIFDQGLLKRFCANN